MLSPATIALVLHITSKSRHRTVRVVSSAQLRPHPYLYGAAQYGHLFGGASNLAGRLRVGHAWSGPRLKHGRIDDCSTLLESAEAIGFTAAATLITQWCGGW